jgi:hypothetical protein
MIVHRACRSKDELDSACCTDELAREWRSPALEKVAYQTDILYPKGMDSLKEGTFHPLWETQRKQVFHEKIVRHGG